MDTETISLREFARRLGIGEKTIRDGIKTGKISKGVVYDQNSKPKIQYEIAVKEVNDVGLGKKVLSVKETIKTKQKPIDDGKDYEGDIATDRVGVLSYSAALRVKENYNARIKELEFKEKEGTLVNKQEVYSQLFEFGKEIRSELESLPGRTASKILNCTDMTKITEILALEIRNSLSKLVDNLSEKKIT